MAIGTILHTLDERDVAEDRRDCCWLYGITNCIINPIIQEPIKSLAGSPGRK